MQRTFAQSAKPIVDDRSARRLTRYERELAKATAKFAEAIAQRVGPVPCLDRAAEAMRSATTELERKSIKPARRYEEAALAGLIEARQNLRKYLAQGGGSSNPMRQLDYQVSQNMPEIPEDEDQEPDNQVQQKLEKLAKAEREFSEEIQAEHNNEAEKDEQTASKNQPPPKSQSPSQGGGQTSPQEGSPAERQEQAAEEAAELARKMQEDEALSDLAQERMAEAERTIRESAESLRKKNDGDAGRQAEEAADQLERLARHVAGLKASELAEKLKAAESLAQKLARGQREAEKEGEGQGKSEKGEQGENPSAEENQNPGQSPGQTPSPSQSPGQGQGEGQGEGQGKGSGGSRRPTDRSATERLAARQRAQAEEARTLDDLLREVESEAGQYDAEFAEAVSQAAQANPPEEIAERIRKAAEALESGREDRAWPEIRWSAEKLEDLTAQLQVVRRGYFEPTLEALQDAEKRAAELQKDLRFQIPARQRAEIEKKMTELRDALRSLAESDNRLGEEAGAFAEALSGGAGGEGDAWRYRGGYYDPPVRYAAAVRRAVRAIQVRIQEIILKDAVLDADQPVPPQYKKEVEQYLKILSDDLR
ncbi:MAG: hypothetical protein JXB10_10990 [Pirellulales bacterium]|nr:hypothetical protein [Pirellulales bacterium]